MQYRQGKSTVSAMLAMGNRGSSKTVFNLSSRVQSIYDYGRLEKAERKRTRKLLKAARDNNTCIAFNACYKLNHR